MPGDVLDLAPWSLTLPVADPQRRERPRTVHPPALSVFADEHFHLASGGAGVELLAPAVGVATSAASGATRTELRELVPAARGLRAAPASWGFADGRTHQLTVTLAVDPTGLAARREVIVGQVHDATDHPPLYVAVGTDATGDGWVRLHVNGPSVRPALLAPYRAGALFTYRIEVGAGRVLVAAAPGDLDALPPEPVHTLPTDLFAAQRDGCYFKVGAYNKQRTSDPGGGASRVVLHRVDLVTG